MLIIQRFWSQKILSNDRFMVCLLILVNKQRVIAGSICLSIKLWFATQMSEQIDLIEMNSLTAIDIQVLFQLFVCTYSIGFFYQTIEFPNQINSLPIIVEKIKP